MQPNIASLSAAILGLLLAATSALAHHGWSGQGTEDFTLKGTVDWQYQKDTASRAVRDLKGVLGFENLIVVQPKVKAGEVRDKIEAAFKRSAELDARRIAVSAQDGKVVLSGNVRTWAERREAERAGVLLGECPDPGQHAEGLRRPQLEDGRPDVPDRGVEVGDRLVEPLAHEPVVDLAPHALQLQAGREQPLDHDVVEGAGDPVAVAHDGQLGPVAHRLEPVEGERRLGREGSEQLAVLAR